MDSRRQASNSGVELGEPAMSKTDDLSDHSGSGHLRDDLIFSLTDGFVWASWPGTVASVKLGTWESVTAVMRDFLAQCELGDRLTNAKTLGE